MKAHRFCICATRGVGQLASFAALLIDCAFSAAAQPEAPSQPVSIDVSADFAGAEYAEDSIAPGPEQAPDAANQPARGTQAPEPAAKPLNPAFRLNDGLFPSDPRPLMPYLQLTNRLGTNALQPGALIAADPISTAAQAVKTELAKIGLTYTLQQNFLGSLMSNRVQGDAALAGYSHELFLDWTIFDSEDLGGTSGWITATTASTVGFGFDANRQNPQLNIGAASSPNANYYGTSFGVEELAWAQSFSNGRFVVALGLVNQTNYLDLNRYANSSYGQLINTSFVNSLVIPMALNNLGVVAQWQPCDSFYAMLSAAANNQLLGRNPWRDLSADNMSYVGELGFIVPDLGGLGPGTYRLQPFLATVDGDSGGGIAFNLEQQLGASSPLGAFARIGLGDNVTARVPSTSGVKTQAAAGLALLSPFSHSGIFSEPNNDYAAIGFVWSRAGEEQGQFHRDEYGLELTVALQLTPTMTIQPDLQFIWDPANNPDDGPSVVAQLQLNIEW